MADDRDKTRPDMDPADLDKTVVDVPRPRQYETPADNPDKTMVMSRDPAPSGEADRTMVAGVRAPSTGYEVEGERTVVQGGIAAPRRPVGTPSGFEIVCLSGPTKGGRFDIPKEDGLIGSNPTCHIMIGGIESAHAKVRVQGEEFEIQNLGTPGSIVLAGGRKVSNTKVKVGDLMKLGDVVVRFIRSGDVFSADYDEAAFAGSFMTSLFAPEKRLYLFGGIAGIVVLLLLMLTGGNEQVVVKKQTGPSPAQAEREKRINGLLETGELLLNEGRLFAPQEQPEAENAFAKFNDVLAMDPGNARAIANLKKIDVVRNKERLEREEAKKRAAEAARKALEERVNAALRKGDELFDAGKIAEPAGNNALIRYREALTIDPTSVVAKERIQKALQHYVDLGDRARDKNDWWVALENYRRGSRAAEGKDANIEARLKETEAHLKAGMAGSDSMLIMYRDDNGRMVVLDEMDKVPSRYRDRALEVQPVQRQPGAQ